jgi:hypothetical protein
MLLVRIEVLPLPTRSQRDKEISMAKASCVSRQALIARVNRRLAKQNESLRRCPENRRDYRTLGDFYILDISRNAVLAKHVDLQKLAKKLGSLKPGERLSD